MTRTVYVGHVSHCQDLPQLAPTAHPRRFTLDQAPEEAWTCNPYLVDAYDYDDVVVIAEDGQRRRLSEHPGAVEWRDHMKAGEFWATVGEAWVGVKP